MQPDGGSLEPDATDDGCYYMETADDQDWFRRSQVGGLASLIVDVCASLLKEDLFNLCLYSDIVAFADSIVFELMYSILRGPWLVI